MLHRHSSVCFRVAPSSRISSMCGSTSSVTAVAVGVVVLHAGLRSLIDDERALEETMAPESCLHMDPLLDDFAQTRSTPFEVSGKGGAKKPRAPQEKGNARGSGGKEAKSGEKDSKSEAPEKKCSGALVRRLLVT